LGSHRAAAARGGRLLAGAWLTAGLVVAPVVPHAPAVGQVDRIVATREATVDPRLIGTARTAPFGSTVGSGGTDVPSPGVPRQDGPSAQPAPGRFHLPHWLPGRSARPAAGQASNATNGRAGTGVGGGAGAGAAARVPATASAFAGQRPGATAGGAVLAGPAAPSNPAASGVGLRSELGTFGLSNADDALLYADCSVSQLCEEPPDPGIAVSAGAFVQSVNELVMIVDRTTNGYRIIPNTDFFALDGNQVTQSDPRVLFDATHGRWVAAEISSDCGHGYLHLAVSATDDPFDIWTVYRIVFKGRIPDFPGLGSSGSTVQVGLNAFAADPSSPGCLSPGDFEGAMLVVVDWSDLVAAVPSLPATTTTPDAGLFTWRPTTTAPGDTLARLVVGIDNGTDSSADIGYATISGTNADRSVTVSDVVNLTREQGLPALDSPPAPRQPGDPPTIARAVDGDPTDAIAAAGHLWFIATASCMGAGETIPRDCVRVTELLTSDGPTSVSVASDVRLEESGFDLYMGGLGRAVDGTLYVVYSRSSPAQQIEDWATYRRPAEAAFGAPALLIPGGGTYSGSRWGDYVILAPDPAAPDAVWQADEVAGTDGSWFTWISRIRPAVRGISAGEFSINGGDRYAANANVDLSIHNPATGALTLLRVSNDPDVRDGLLAGGLTLPVADLMPWSLGIDRPESGPADGVHRVYVQWGDGQGNWSDVASSEIVLDTTGPTIGVVDPPSIGSSTLDPRGGVPVALRWQAGFDALSGLQGYDVEVRQDAGSWEDFATVSSPRASGRIQGGHRYQWRVRSVDQLGNVSRWVATAALRIDALDDSAGTIRYGAGWRSATSSSSFRGSVHVAARAGATAEFSFTGSVVALVGTVGPGRGAIDVFVDGRPVGRFSQAASSVRVGRIGLIRALSAADKRHTVRLVSADARPVDLDAVILVRAAP
jgi:hypothetical protein